MKPQPGSPSLPSVHWSEISSGVIVKKNAAMKSARAIGILFRCLALLVVAERHGVELEPMVDKLVAQLARDFGLQALDFLGLKFDHFAVARVDQMIVVGIGAGFIACPPITEIVPLDNPGIFKKPHRAIDGRNRNMLVDLGTAPVEFLNIRMIVRLR